VSVLLGSSPWFTLRDPTRVSVVVVAGEPVERYSCGGCWPGLSKDS